MENYDKLLDLSRQLGMYSSISSLLTWDNETNVPTKGAKPRSQQLAFIEEQVVTLFNKPETKNVVQNLDQHIGDLDSFQKRNFEVFKRAFVRRTAVPKELLIENKKQESQTFAVWQKAKHANDYKLYAPELAKNIENKRRIANYIDSNKIPFDVYLDQFEPGFSSKKLDEIFSSIKPKIISLLTKTQKAQSELKELQLDLKMPKDVQRKMVSEIAKFIGFDLERGRIDEVEHPMTIGINNPLDVRFSVKYNENNFTDALLAGMHEAGHAIHGQNVNPEYVLQPVSLFGGSAGISESQSRFFENLIGRSETFWNYYLPTFEKITGKKVNLQDFLLRINKVELSKIRIHADELTYPLHIILRFEIEKGMLDGSYNANELASVWNEKFKEYFGIEIKNDSDGIMQDIHWASRFYGYFPSYALGNIYNAQMYYALKKELDFDGLVEEGNITPIRTWLNKHVHEKTGLYDPIDFIKNISHEDVNPDYFFKYLEEKYTKLLHL